MTGPPGHPPGASPEPPAARRIHAERTHHGDTVIDEYAWLADKDAPETLRYLEAENAYTAAMTAGQAGLRGDLRRDQGAHAGDRPVGAGPQGRLVVLLAHGRWQAVLGALPARRPARRGCPAGHP